MIKMNYYVVVAREEYKEEDVFYYQGDYSYKELEELATKEVRDNTTMEYGDIEEWEKENKIEIHDKRQDKINLKYQIYLDQKKIYNNKESGIEEKEKAMNILLSHFLKRVE